MQGKIKPLNANLDSGNSRIFDEKCGLQEKFQGSYLKG